jgi:hypothetical protein
MAVRTFGINGATDTAESFRLAAGGLWVPASALNSRTGVTSPPVLTGTGSFTCTVGAFTCVIDGTLNSLQGSYPVALDAATTVTINAANTQARIDLISLQIQDNDYDGSGLHQGTVVYTAGTPGSGTAPASPADSIALFNVPVAANAVSVVFANATAVYPYTAAAGGIVPARNGTDKPAAVNGAQYRHRLDVTAAAGSVSPLESSTDGTTWTPVFDPGGFQWQAFSTSWTAASGTNPAQGNGTMLMRYIKLGRLVFIHFRMFTGSTTTYGTGGQWIFSLPYAATSAVTNHWIGGAVASINPSTFFYGSVNITGNICSPFFGNGVFATSATPGTWNSGSYLDMDFFYESST